MKNDRTDELREVSGKIVYSDPLTSFLYQLMRDELPAGTVEKLVRDVVNEGTQDILFTNGWLAQYANNLAEMLKNAHTEKLKETLTKVFDDQEEKEKAKVAINAKNRLRKNGTLEEFTDDEIAELESKVVTACKKAEEIKDVQDDGPVVAWTSFEEAAAMIEHLKAEGQITKEDADKLSDELKEAEIDIRAEELEKAKDNDEDEIIELTDEVIEEIKPPCCGNCHKNVTTGMCESSGKPSLAMSSNGEAFSSGTITCQEDKWQNTQAFLDEVDKDLEKLKTRETKVVIVEPKTVSAEECNDIKIMLDNIDKVLENIESKKEE